jgi:hypothetical protein
MVYIESIYFVGSWIFRLDNKLLLKMEPHPSKQSSQAPSPGLLSKTFRKSGTWVVMGILLIALIIGASLLIVIWEKKQGRLGAVKKMDRPQSGEILPPRDEIKVPAQSVRFKKSKGLNLSP